MSQATRNDPPVSTRPGGNTTQTFRHNPYAEPLIISFIPNENNKKRDNRNLTDNQRKPIVGENMNTVTPYKQQRDAQRSRPLRDYTDSRPPIGNTPDAPQSTCFRCGNNCLDRRTARETLAMMEAGTVPKQRNRGKGEIKKPHKFRTTLCKHMQGECPHCCMGQLCWMAHSEADVRAEEDNREFDTHDSVVNFLKAHLKRKALEEAT